LRLGDPGHPEAVDSEVLKASHRNADLPLQFKLRQSDVRVPLGDGFGRSPIHFDTEPRAFVFEIDGPVIGGRHPGQLRSSGSL
jgi:hypothetical protein